MLITKMNNAIKTIMNTPITDQIQKVLEDTFKEIGNKDHWKNPTNPENMTFTFGNWELLVQKIGLIALTFNHFHGGYELNRIGDSDTIEIYSKGYHHYASPVGKYVPCMANYNDCKETFLFDGLGNCPKCR